MPEVAERAEVPARRREAERGVEHARVVARRQRIVRPHLVETVDGEQRRIDREVLARGAPGTTWRRRLAAQPLDRGGDRIERRGVAARQMEQRPRPEIDEEHRRPARLRSARAGAAPRARRRRRGGSRPEHRHPDRDPRRHRAPVADRRRGRAPRPAAAPAPPTRESRPRHELARSPARPPRTAPAPPAAAGGRSPPSRRRAAPRARRAAEGSRRRSPAPTRR